MTDLDMCNGLTYKLRAGVPKISEMSAQKVVSVSIYGDPNEQTKLLMPPLYTTAYAVRKIMVCLLKSKN